MQSDIVISGFGGQGILFAGEILSQAAMTSGLETCWFPSYGPEMRGGTAFCSVIISDQPIASPIIEHPTAVLALNLPSFIKYEKLLTKGGSLIVNSSMVDMKAERKDIECISIPATDMAEELGDKRVSNIAALGALVSAIKILDLKYVREALKLQLAGKAVELLDLNLRVLERGFAFKEGDKGNPPASTMNMI